MAFRYKFIKTFLSLIILFGFVGHAFAIDTERPLLHEITIENQNLISVKVYAPKYIQNNSIFTFNNATPNYYLEENNTQKIQNFKVVLNNGEVVSHETAFKIKVEDDFNYLEYQFVVNEIDDSSFIPVNNLISENPFLNFSSFIGSFDTDTLNELTIKVFRDRGRIYSETNQFNYFINNPFCFCNESNLIFKETSYSVLVNDTNFLSVNELNTLVSESLEALVNYSFLKEISNRRLIFLFNNTSKNAGAITKDDNIVFHFNSNDKYIIQKTIIHELLHWIIPTQNDWLNESIPEYLAIKTLLKNKMISKDDFLNIMSEKIKLADGFKQNNLNEIYQNNHLYKALYSKGAIHAWVLDLAIMNTTKSEFSIEQYILEPNKVPKETTQNIIQELLMFNQKYILENQKLLFNTYLNTIGILFEKNKLKEIKEKQKMLLFLKNNKITIKDPANLSCLQKNDIIYALDGKKEIDAIYEKMNSLSNKKSHITILRGQKKLRFLLNNEKSVMQKIPFNLTFITETTKSQKRNWRKFATQTN